MNAAEARYARLVYFCLTAATSPLTRHPANRTSPPTRTNPIPEGHSAYLIRPAMATAGRQHRVGVPTSRRRP